MSFFLVNSLIVLMVQNHANEYVFFSCSREKKMIKTVDMFIFELSVTFNCYAFLFIFKKCMSRFKIIISQIIFNFKF